MSPGFCVGVRQAATAKGRQWGKKRGAWEQGTPFPPVLQRRRGEAVCLTERFKREVPTAGWPHPSHSGHPQQLSTRAAVMLPCLDAARPGVCFLGDSGKQCW